MSEQERAALLQVIDAVAILINGTFPEVAIDLREKMIAIINESELKLPAETPASEGASKLPANDNDKR